MLISVYPSQDDPTKTLWIFTGTGSIAPYTSTIRSSGNYHARDSWQLQPVGSAPFPTYTTNFYTANKPTNRLFNLSPLFSSTNNPIDIESVQARLQGTTAPFYSGTIFPTNVTNAPTIRIGTSKTIGWLFMNDTANFDEMGIRGTPPNNLVFTNGQTSRLFGAGILNKPIGDFLTSDNDSRHFDSRQGAPYFGNIFGVFIHSRAIPEPEEYALVFGLFALAFVILKNAYERRNGRDLANPNPKTSPSLSEHRLNN